jgi:hypothetical protein
MAMTAGRVAAVAMDGEGLAKRPPSDWYGLLIAAIH